ncbi:MAG: N-acyl-D-amino-acid deacylase [Thermomicrobiales bacterium]|nr:N-acyl-D-amino-acid deacylase [Thermomicrobiales bacterium]
MERWIIGGTVVDGLGAPARRANLRLVDDSIAEVGPDVVPPEGAAGQVIDATGLVVAPGFIDLHTHSDVALLADPAVACKLNQGITLELIGQDGMSVAPLTDETASLWRKHLGGLSGSYDVDWSWRSFAEYLDQFGPTAANVAALVGHGTLRLNVIGMANRPATPAEVDRMRGLLEEALAAGAFGLSGGLVYTPGSYADFAELVALNKVVAAAGKIWVVHVRFEGDRIGDALDEMFRLVDETGVALHISHFKLLGKTNWGRAAEVVARIEEQRARGQDVTVDQYPYTAGSTMLSATLPPWAHADGPDQLREYLRDPVACARMERDIIAGLPEWEGFIGLAGWENIQIADVGGQERPDVVGSSLAELGERWNCSPFAAAVRLLLDYDLAVAMIVYAMDDGDVQTILRQPWRMGGTDALLGGKPHPRAYGSYPRILGRYVRDLGVLSLEEAVRQMTGAAAERLRLADRGAVVAGRKADLCLFDPARAADRATFADPTQLPEGIAWVLVNGQPVLHDRELTGALPGRLLRQGDGVAAQDRSSL